MNNPTSSKLISRLESINWSFAIHAKLNGIDTTMLVKYLIEDESYGILLSDFATTYFECSIGAQIEENHQKFNKVKMTHANILACLQDLFKSLPSSVNHIDKIQVDCHTSRITFKCTKKLANNSSFKWNFYIISTGPEIFFKHFSFPMLRGLLYYYNLCQHRQQQQAPLINCETNQSGLSEQQPQETPHEQSAKESSELIIEDTSSKQSETFNQVTDEILHELFRI